jgi:assimilatory nitrate reductase electron transfer subunit
MTGGMTGATRVVVVGHGKIDVASLSLPRTVRARTRVLPGLACVALDRPGRVAAVVGAGVLGLEVACGLARRGLAVTVVHGGPHLMDRQLDAGAAASVADGLTSLGIGIRVAARTQPPEGGTGLIAQGWDQARRLAVSLTGRRSGASAPDLTPVRAGGTDVVRLKAPGLDVVTMGVSGSRRAEVPGAR